MPTESLHFVSFRDNPILYGRVPKVANTSIKVALSKLLKQRPESGVRVQSDAYWRSQTHGETEMVSPETAMLLRDEKFCFSFVRNPFDRIVSCYHNKILDEAALTPIMREAGYEHRMGFAEFMALTASIPDAELDVHLMPQAEMLTHEGRLVPQFIGHFENLEAEWLKFRRRLFRRFELKIRKLPTKNIRRGGDVADVKGYFCTDALIDIVSTKYSRDLELFYAGIAPGDLVTGQFIAPELTALAPKGKGRRAGAEAAAAAARGNGVGFARPDREGTPRPKRKARQAARAAKAAAANIEPAA